uniref:(northern house mosquito) hypothetical protein n=1 Tax=Culex pipiens TaxID=7175 RepID=A0A8D8AIQ3_CULPI
MCCWVELGFSPNSPQTHTVISADFRARPCSAQCVLIFLVFFNQEGDFSFYFASSTAQISRHDLWRQKCGPFVVIVRDWFFFFGCVGEFVFFFVQIYLNLNLIGDIPSGVGVSLALCFVGGHIPRLRDKKVATQCTTSCTRVPLVSLRNRVGLGFLAVASGSGVAR